MKAFMFHYVREENDAQEYSRYFDLTEFRSLVRGLKERYSFKSIEEAYETGSPGDIALTFDDGLKDHLDVAEFLHSIDVPASFYIPAQPNENQGLLTVHLAHQIVSESGPKALGLLFDELEKSGIEREEWVDKEKEGRFKTRYSTHRNEDQEIRLFKRLINYELPVSLAKTLVSNIADRIGLEPKPEEVYLTREEIRHVSDLGFRIGSHGITHVPISRLSSREQLKELSLSKERLEALIDKPVTSFCYPYGRRSSYTDTSIELLKKCGYSLGISVESCDIDDISIRHSQSMYEIPRYDCNEMRAELELERD